MTVTAGSTACTAPEYQFWLLAPGAANWTLAQPYSTNANFDWNTINETAGNWLIEIWAKDATSTASWDAVTNVPYTITPFSACTGATGSPSPASPQSVGTTVTFTGGSATCSTPYYEFWYFVPGATNWTLGQGYSSSTTYNWNTTGFAAGTYLFEVFARDASSTAYYDSYVNLSYTIQ